MTHEDVISWLEYLSDDARSKADGFVPTNIEIACCMAIDALKAQEPRLVTKDDFVNADEYGWLPAWCEEECTSAVYCECIRVDALKEKGVRYWTSKPTDEQREAVKWE